VRQNYVLDAATTMRTNLRKTLATTPRSAVRRPTSEPAPELAEVGS
jgi:monooxygenase